MQRECEAFKNASKRVPTLGHCPRKCQRSRNYTNLISELCKLKMSLFRDMAFGKARSAEMYNIKGI